MMTAGYNTGSKWRDIQLEANWEISDTYYKQAWDETTYSTWRENALADVSRATAPGSDSDYEWFVVNEWLKSDELKANKSQYPGVDAEGITRKWRDFGINTYGTSLISSSAPEPQTEGEIIDISSSAPEPQTEGEIIDISYPTKFSKKSADKITNFNPSTDTLEIDTDIFGIDSSATFASGKNKKVVKKKLAKQDFDFLYDEKKGGLYFNENGADKGFGEGGIIAILKGAPELTSGNLEFI